VPGQDPSGGPPAARGLKFEDDTHKYKFEDDTHKYKFEDDTLLTHYSHIVGVKPSVHAGCHQNFELKIFKKAMMNLQILRLKMKTP
jgi:hypothetical protein